MLLSTDLKSEELSVKRRPCSQRSSSHLHMCVPGGAERAVRVLRMSKKNQCTGRSGGTGRGNGHMPMRREKTKGR